MNISQAAAAISANPAQWFHFSDWPREVVENTANTSRVITSCMPLSCGAESTTLPRRLAGTCRQYSKKAMPQLTRMTANNGDDQSFRCPYQAMVMKMFEPNSSTTGSRRSGRLGMTAVVHVSGPQRSVFTAPALALRQPSQS